MPVFKLKNFSVHHIGLHKRQIIAGVGNDFRVYLRIYRIEPLYSFPGETDLFVFTYKEQCVDVGGRPRFLLPIIKRNFQKTKPRFS
jgi:hypothetical protein